MGAPSGGPPAFSLAQIGRHTSAHPPVGVSPTGTTIPFLPVFPKMAERTLLMQQVPRLGSIGPSTQPLSLRPKGGGVVVVAGAVALGATATTLSCFDTKKTLERAHYH